jgi:hypothetical protein
MKLESKRSRYQCDYSDLTAGDVNPIKSLKKTSKLYARMMQVSTGPELECERWTGLLLEQRDTVER